MPLCALQRKQRTGSQDLVQVRTAQNILARAVAVCLLLLAFASLAWTEAMVRQERIVDLAGAWQFVPDPDMRLSIRSLEVVQDWRTIDVPSSWQPQFPDLISYNGVAWYRRAFVIPPAWQGRTLRLRFGAVDYAAEVWLNGQPVGTHEGGYTPFAFDITNQVRYGKDSDLVVRVTDPANDRERFPDFPFAEIPSGKQQHYCQSSGIWQRVWVEARPDPFIRLVHVAPDIDRGLARVRLGLEWSEHMRPTATAVRVRALDADHRVVAEDTAPLQLARREYHMTLPIPSPHLWEPDDPYLYTLEAATMVLDGPTDTVTDTFGMRKVEARDHHVYLNNHPIFLTGALDQAFYPRTIYREPSDAELEAQFRQAKHLGLNFLRVHIKVPDPRYCAAADRVGLLLWMDMPNFWQTSPAAKERLANTMRAAIERDFNHPSIFAWCLLNEEWGVPFDDAAERAWVKQLWHEAKQLDPTRLVVDNSPAGHGHVISDIEDQHCYMSMPEHRREFERWCDEFANHPAYTFRYPDSERRGFEPLILSEFGNWGLPEVEPILRYYDGTDPYWFDQHNYGGPIRGGLDLFHEWRLDDVFGSFGAMAREMQWHQYAALKTQIEIMRRHPGIVGYVITQFTDLNSESNGLLDMTRRAKQYHDALGAVQAQDAVVPVWDRCVFWSGKEISLPVLVSHFSTRDIRDATLGWKVDGRSVKSEVAGVRVELASAPQVAVAAFAAPEVEKTSEMRLRFELVDAGNEVIAQGHFDFVVIPDAVRRAPAGLACTVRDNDDLAPLSERLAAAGATVAPDAGLEIASVVDAGLVQRLKAGARVLLLASVDTARALPFSPLRIDDRGAKSWWGDWMSNVNWQRSELFPNLPQAKLQGMAYESVTPKSVITSVGPENSPDVLMGIFAGWMHDPAALTAQFRVGKGVLLVTTFELARGYGADPMATAMMHDLLDYLRSDRITPATTLDLASAMRSKIALPTAEQGRHAWRYTASAPRGGWEQPEFDDGEWQQGEGGFGTEGTPNTTVRTAWDTVDIWLRAEFSLDAAPARATLHFYHDEDAEFYLNGYRILERTGFVPHYQMWELPEEAQTHLRAGRNTLAIHCRQTTGGQYIDAGLSVLEP
jgi:hypothetical protein